jgi:hypothetical protein
MGISVSDRQIRKTIVLLDIGLRTQTIGLSNIGLFLLQKNIDCPALLFLLTPALYNMLIDKPPPRSPAWPEHEIIL